MGVRGAPGNRRGPPPFRGLAGRGVLVIILLALLTVALVLSAPRALAQRSLTIEMRDVLSFEPAAFSVDPGENVTLRLVNDGLTPHTFTLFEEANAQVPVRDNAALQDFYGRSQTLVDEFLEGGGEATVNFTIPTEEGVYTFVCIISGHSAGGMHGVVFVGMAGGGGDLFGGIGIIQGLLIFTLIGVVVFAVIYHVRSTRP